MEASSLKEKAVQSTFWSFIDLWGNKIGSFAVFFILVRLLSPEAFGVLTLAWTFVIFIQNFADLGFTQAIIQREHLEKAHLDTAYQINVGVSVLLLLLTLAAIGLAGNFVSDRVLLDVIAWLTVCLPLRSLTRVQEAVLVREFRFKTLTLRSLLATAAGGIAGIGMAVAGYGVWSLVGQQITFQAMSTLVLWKAASWQPALHFSKRHFRELFAFGRSIIGARTMDFLNRRSDSLLIGLFLGPAALGYYAVAYKIVLVFTEGLTKMISSVTLPVFARMQSDRKHLRHAYYAATKLLVLLTFPVFMGLAVAAPVMVPVVFGDAWDASIPVMQVLAMLGIAQCLFNFEQGILLAMGRPEWQFQINIVSAAAGLAAFFVSYNGGILAVAVAFAIRGYLMVPLGLALTKTLIDVHIKQYLIQFVAPLGGVLAVFLIAILVETVAGSYTNMVVLLLQVILGALGYGLITTLLDREYIHSIARMGKSFLLPGAP